MKLTESQKRKIKQQLAVCLAGQREIRKVIIFGSFLTSDDPDDLDVAVFQDSDETYLPLALRYRKLLRPVADQIPLDVVPIRPVGAHGEFLDAIEKGEVVYEQ